MRFGILGPLEVTEGGHHLRVGGPKVRTLLAVLLVRANEVVSADQLAEILWEPTPSPGGDGPETRSSPVGDGPETRSAPGDRLNALQTQVSRLRTAIDPVSERAGRPEPRRLLGYGQGYLLQVEPDELDAMAFEAASQEARAALARGDAAEAWRRADEALAHWRGRALDEFAHEPFAEARAAQLEEQRLVTVECRVDAGLALGRHQVLVGDLQQLATQNPLREPLWGQLMLALYRSGRQSEALRTYERLRLHLADELGINPSAELTRLEGAVLAQDPALDWHGAPDLDAATAPSAPPEARPRPPTGEPGESTERETVRPVTFLFTDVEHGTALWDRDPAAMGAALRAHDALVRAAVDAHHGHVFARPGDGFCAVFDRAADAVQAAVQAQSRLTAPDGAGPAGPAGPVQLQVRMAIHTGDAEEREGNFFGTAVNRTARMRDAAHGGQVLVSATTRELILDAQTDDMELTDIGTWLFEGFSRSERVYQLDHPTLRTGFPPLRSGRPQTGNAIPRTPTSFVGRRQEIEWVAATLGEHPLVTITGEGGVGKTRLAIEVAQRTTLAHYPDGVWFCDLSVHDTESVAEAVAAALKLVTSVGADVRSQVVTHLQSARLLLLLDNCERVREPVAELVTDILTAGSEARFLATSRAPLRVSGEHVLQLDTLALPAEDDPRPATAPAVRLLVDRARAAGAQVDEQDPALVAIARELDGMPLAIELAAPRLAMMSAQALAERLDRHLELLSGSGGRPERQRTLRATIDWSFDLLSPDARQLFGALSVFRGGWTLEAAEAITVATGLDAEAVAPLVAELAEQSMIRVDLPAQGTARYRLLETLRAYAADHLAAAGQYDIVAETHAQHFIGIAEKAARYRRGPLEPAWISEIEVEFDNLRAAYRWAIDSGRAADGLRLLAALSEDIMRDRLELGRWAEELADLPASAEEPLRAVALGIAGHTAMIEFRADDALRLSLQALEVEQATDAPPSWIPRTTLALMMALGFAEGDARKHLRSLEEISEATGDPLPAAVADFDRCRIAALVGTPGRSLHAAERLLAAAERSGNPTLLAMGLVSHGRAVAATDAAQAVADYRRAIHMASSVGNTVLSQQAIRALEELNAVAGDRTAALAALRTVATTFERSGNVTEQLQTVISMLDPLAAIDAWGPLATICGALGQTPWRLSSGSQDMEAGVATALGQDEYLARHQAGAAMSPSELVAFVSGVIKQLAGDG